jgi:hypothetical protein
VIFRHGRTLGYLQHYHLPMRPTPSTLIGAFFV